MTVGDVIRELAELPEETPVVVWYETGTGSGYADVAAVYRTEVAPRSPNGLYPQFRHHPERNTVKAVVIE